MANTACQGPFTGAEAVRQIAVLAQPAAAPLDTAITDVLAFAVATSTPAELFAALQPLVVGSASPKGRPPQNSTLNLAYAIVEALITDGYYDATGLTGTIVRRLTALTGPGGPLQRDARRQIYRVVPAYAEAVQVFSAGYRS